MKSLALAAILAVSAGVASATEFTNYDCYGAPFRSNPGIISIQNDGIWHDYELYPWEGYVVTDELGATTWTAIRDEVSVTTTQTHNGKIIQQLHFNTELLVGTYNIDYDTYWFTCYETPKGN